MSHHHTYYVTSSYRHFIDAVGHPDIRQLAGGLGRDQSRRKLARSVIIEEKRPIIEEKRPIKEEKRPIIEEKRLIYVHTHRSMHAFSLLQDL